LNIYTIYDLQSPIDCGNTIRSPAPEAISEKRHWISLSFLVYDWYCTLNHFPLSDTSDSAYSAWLVKHSLPPYLGKPCFAVFTVGNGDIIFEGNFVNPATHSASLVAAKATLRTTFCVLFSDKECKRFNTFQATKAIQLSRKIDLIAAIGAHISIQDMLGLDSLTPLLQVHTFYKETLLIVHPDKNNGVVVDGESQAFQKEISISDLGQLRCQPVLWLLGLRQPLGLLPSLSLMGPRTVPLLHLTTTFLVTKSLRTLITLITIGMQVCNFFSDKEIAGKLCELRDFTCTSALPVGKDRTKFASCLKKVLVLVDISGLDSSA